MSKVRQAELVINGAKDVRLLGVKANGAVKGRLLVMTLEQRYRNASDRNAEITYTFPLPSGAVLMEVEVTLNGQVLKGEVSPRNTARAQYEEALSEGNSSIMLEKNRDGSFTLELGNLMAREECNILVRYAQVLATEHGQVRLMLPTTLAPRYGNPVTQGKLQPHQVPVVDLTAEYPFDITLMLMGDMAFSNVSSPSHKTSYIRNKEALVIKLSQRGYLDRDFVLIISNLRNISDGLASLDRYVDGQSAMMAFFSPQIESAAPKTMTAKILVDCSSSMAGDSIEAARRALQEIVNGLAPEDKFSLSRFGTTVEHRSAGLWSGTERAKASARRWIGNVNANLGGTEMAAALMSTIAIPDAGMSDILLITDGEIEGIDEVIELAKKSKHRVFIVAIGASPSEVHLRSLAVVTEGQCDFVAPGEDVEPAVIRMSARMRAARATDLRVDWPKSLVIRWEQTLQQHAFANDVLNACAFVDAPADDGEFTTVKLWGRIDGQESEVLLAEAPLTLTASSTNITARLTAHTRCQELQTQRMSIGDTASLSNSQDLAVTYKLVTDETNFILVHERSEEEKAQEMPDAYKVPQMLAAGWGGSGSVVGARLGSHRVRLSVSQSQPVYGSLSTPSVWRTNRTQASVRVDALSNGGMDDYEIPAFLRKQADGGVYGDAQSYGQIVRNSIDKRNPLLWLSKDLSGGRKVLEKNFGFYGITPAGMDRWLATNHPTFWPKTYAELHDLGLTFSICEWLEFEIGAKSEEAVVVSTFLAVVHELGLSNSVGIKGAVQSIKRVISSNKTVQIAGEMATKIRIALNGAIPQAWPKSVVNFPEIATT
jgi:Ca-activated chloride channel homolog